ncbi:MBL fold metallo-hydrolase [Paenibacillus paeoniae]|uniref:MBL fold metallo-hydrolase n=1 Tax=Paenibacillus paeoniae TaxID=2292705 RepID=A0A371PI61_9BACL|nr:MBL fold metallo-hydrolase [Paenibacillus paeoniae]REK75888.1 MBL fold metallo-hydrolase [Paenibacillus paeoniae]
MNTNISTLAHGWLQVKVPLPFSLKWVNSYIIPEREGVTVIDPGLGTPEAKELWTDVLAETGLDWGDIKRIMITHQHPDHYGLAGYMQERSGAPVCITERSHAYAMRLWGEGSGFPKALRELYIHHGMPGEIMDRIERNLDGFIELVSPQPQVEYIAAGQRLVLGDWEWELIDAPGHAYGAVCFYQPDIRWMVCGDQVLPHITPNISVVPGEEKDPLEAFLGSLEQLKSYDVALALPGHRDPFTDFQGRIDELISHHVRRLDRMAELLKHESCTAFALCETLFGVRLRDNPHNLRFAMSETLAHLYYLEREGRIRSREVGAALVYETF